MLSKEKQKRISNEKWKELVEEYKKSDVSKYEFCNGSSSMTASHFAL